MIDEIKLKGPQTLEMKALKDSGVWELKCDCGNTKKYINWFSFKKAYKRDMYRCDSCKQIGRVASEVTKKNMSIAALNRKTTLENEQIRRESIRKSLTGHDRYIGEVKRQWSEKISEATNGHPVSDSTRKKLRKARIRQREEAIGNGHQLHPSYNPRSISILEHKATDLKIDDLQHAENGGEFYIKELGYWVDGYSPTKNIVIEYYEKRHNRTTKRDARRMKEIKNYLKCEVHIIRGD